jgi:hypothetical protein
MKINGLKNLQDLQAGCSHTTAYRDYYHGDYTIWCADCKMRWQRGDTRTNLVCSLNSQMRNHTGKSFQDMEDFLNAQHTASGLMVLKGAQVPSN